VAFARGDGVPIADLEAALKLWSSLELPLEVARTRFELARALAAGEFDTAVEHARLAMAGFESLGASRDADRVAAFLRSAGIVPRTGPKGTGTLTGREREMALMFFPDRIRALREMARVTVPSGTVAVLVPASLDAQPAYGPFVEVAARHAGREARSLLTTYFACGDLDELTGWFGRAGLCVTATTTHSGSARLPSSDALVTTEVESTPLGERISAEVYDRIKRDAREVLAPFTADDGTLEAPFRVHVIAARR